MSSLLSLYSQGYRQNNLNMEYTNNHMASEGSIYTRDSLSLPPFLKKRW